MFDGGPSRRSCKGGAAADTGVISPGHKFLWAYNLKPARYVVLCFWPSKRRRHAARTDGHAHRHQARLTTDDSLPPRTAPDPGGGRDLVRDRIALTGELPGLPLSHGVLVGARVVRPEVAQPHRGERDPGRRTRRRR